MMLVGQGLSPSSLCPTQALISILSFRHAIGWLLERLPGASLSPEARGFTEAKAGLEVHAGAKVSIATVVFQYACLEEALKDQAAKFCSCAIRIEGWVKVPVHSGTLGKEPQFALGSAGREMMT